jgi:RNA polymerase sigma factor (sigma-70 family)
MPAAGMTFENRAMSQVTLQGAAQFPDDETLVTLARLGDGPVLNELYRRHAERIFRVARRITRHREDAEDAVQETFLNAYIHVNNFEGRAKFSTWLTRIGVNAALMKVRKTRTSRELSIDELAETLGHSPLDKLVEPAPNPEQNRALLEQKTALKAAILQLRPALRRAVDIYLLLDGSVADTAQALGLSIAATKGRLFHAKLELRKSTGGKRRAYKR